MRLTFDINTEKESTNLHIEFDDKERATGRWGKLLALEYLTYSLIENADEELSTRIFDFTAKELEKQKNLNLETTMAEKIYLIVIKDTGVLTGRYECYDSFEKAKKRIEDDLSHWKHERELRETKMKNEFEVWDKEGKYRHTLQIVDLWVH